MELEKIFKITPGITAFIGSGGKTTLIQALAHSLIGRVIICTTTHIYRAGSDKNAGSFDRSKDH